jgi:hypothetical protein
MYQIAFNRRRCREKQRRSSWQQSLLERQHCSCASVQSLFLYCIKIAEAEAAVSVNEQKWLRMHMHVQLKLDDPYFFVGPIAPSTSCNRSPLPLCSAHAAAPPADD